MHEYIHADTLQVDVQLAVDLVALCYVDFLLASLTITLSLRRFRASLTITRDLYTSPPCSPQQRIGYKVNQHAVGAAQQHSCNTATARESCRSPL
jgi:hypothetical protein